MELNWLCPHHLDYYKELQTCEDIPQGIFALRDVDIHGELAPNSGSSGSEYSHLSTLWSISIWMSIRKARVALLNEPVTDIPKYTQTLISFMFLAAK